MTRDSRHFPFSPVNIHRMISTFTQEFTPMIFYMTDKISSFRTVIVPPFFCPNNDYMDPYNTPSWTVCNIRCSGKCGISDVQAIVYKRLLCRIRMYLTTSNNMQIEIASNSYYVFIILQKIFLDIRIILCYNV